MKINTLQTSKKRMILALTVVAVFIISAGLTTYIMLNNSNLNKIEKVNNKQSDKRVNSVDLDPPTKEQVDSGNEKKQESIKKESPPATPSTVGVAITSSNQNGDLLQIRTLIDAVSSSGLCLLHMTKGTQSVDKSADIQAQPSSSTCKGFDVPMNELSLGTWDIVISVTTSTQNGSATGSVDIH